MIKRIYAMSDIHGHLDLLKENMELIDLNNKENMLVFLGDYLDRHNYENIKVLEYIYALEKEYSDQVVTLMGNHELYFLEDIQNGVINVPNQELVKWVKKLTYYYETESQIFVHAGIDEEALEYFHIGTEERYMCEKYPHTVGSFYKDIIAGHISAREIAVKENTSIDDGDIYYDGRSHYYIDGETEFTKKIPVLIYDINEKKYKKIIGKKEQTI